MDYFGKCWQPDDNNNTKEFCHNKFTEDKDRINCSTDLCYLCCDVKDVMYNKSHTLGSLQKCKKKCLNVNSNIKEETDKSKEITK